MTTPDPDATTHPAEIAAIEHVLATVEHAQNNELPDEFLALFRDDAVWTTGTAGPSPVLEQIGYLLHVPVMPWWGLAGLRLRATVRKGAGAHGRMIG